MRYAAEVSKAYEDEFRSVMSCFTVPAVDEKDRETQGTCFARVFEADFVCLGLLTEDGGW